MLPWVELGRAKVPGEGNELILRRRGEEFSIRTAGTELMNSRIHGSEDALADLALARSHKTSRLKILIGGLGMGYTLSAALNGICPESSVVVAELIPDVVSWNEEFLGNLAGNPLSDPRTTVKTRDILDLIKQESVTWDLILLDVDNGPVGLTRKTNNRLYSPDGLKACFKILAPGGILGVWSAGMDEAFSRRLEKCGFRSEAVSVRAVKGKKGSRHTIWLAVKPLEQPPQKPRRSSRKTP